MNDSELANANFIVKALQGANKLLWQEGFTTAQPEVAALEVAEKKALEALATLE